MRLGHRGEIFQRSDLVGQFLAHPDHFVGRPHIIDLRALSPLGRDQTLNAIKCDAAVIANDAPAAISIRKAGDDSGFAAPHDLGRISIEDPIIVRLAVMRECLVHLRGRRGNQPP